MGSRWRVRLLAVLLGTGSVAALLGLTVHCLGADLPPAHPLPMGPPPQALREVVRIQSLADGPVLLARGLDGSLLRARWQAGRWDGWGTVMTATPHHGHAADPTLVAHSLLSGLSLSEDLGATFTRIGDAPPLADVGVEQPPAAGIEGTPARDGRRVAALIATRNDHPQPLWIRTSDDLGMTWNPPVPVPGIRSRAWGAIPERQHGVAVIRDRIIVAGLVDGPDWLDLTVVTGLRRERGILWDGPERMLRLPDRRWMALRVWADDLGAVVLLGGRGLDLVDVQPGRPLTTRHIARSDNNVAETDLLRLPGGRLAVAWSDNRHAGPIGLPLPLPRTRPGSEHMDVHAAILAADGTVRSFQASRTGSHAHGPVLGILDGEPVVVWMEHPLRASTTITEDRGAPERILMHVLPD